MTWSKGCGLFTIVLPLASQLLALPRPAVGQGFSEQVDVRLVDLDVVVTDRKDRPVTDLSRDQFELLIDGRSREIVFFSRNTDDETEGFPKPGPVSHLVLFFDHGSVESLHRDALIESVQRFLREDNWSRVRIMLVSSSRNGLEIHQTFTDDLVEIESGLGQVRAVVAQDQRVVEYQALVRDIQDLSSVAMGYSSRSIGSQVQALQARIGAFASQTREDGLRTGGHLWRLVDVLGGLPGRKAVLVLGGTWSLDAGQVLFDTLRDVLGRSADLETAREGTDLPVGDSSAGFEAIQHLALHASTQGVAFYAVSTGDSRTEVSTRVASGSLEADLGLPPGLEDTWEPGVEFRSRSEAATAVTILANQTGGIAQTKGRDVRPALRQLTNDLRVHYTLAFQPDEADDVAHEIVIRLPDKGLRVRHRRSFRHRDWDLETADRVVSALWFGGDQNPLGVQVEILPPRVVEGDLVVVPLTIRIPLEKLAVEPVEQRHEGQVTVFLTSGADELSTDPVRKVVLPVSIPNEELLGVMGQVADYRLDLPVGARSQRIAVGVRDDLDSRLSTLTLTLDSKETLPGSQSAASATDGTP